MDLPPFGSLGEFLDFFRTMGFWDFQENPGIQNPPEGTLRLYVEDNGAGKSRLVVRDSNGNTNIIWTQP